MAVSLLDVHTFRYTGLTKLQRAVRWRGFGRQGDATRQLCTICKASRTTAKRERNALIKVALYALGRSVQPVQRDHGVFDVIC